MQPDHKKARRMAEKLIGEAPKIIQPNKNLLNLAEAYLDVLEKLGRLTTERGTGPVSISGQSGVNYD